MFIQTEKTPNPATLKFLPGQPVSPRRVAEFKSGDETSNAPLAARLFKIQGVQGVMFGDDFVSISKAEDTDWPVMKPLILAALMEHFSLGLPVMLEMEPAAPAAPDDEISAQIRALITTRVRPAVRMDGGDIDFERFDNGVVYLRMRGACSGCPSSTVTLKMGIENMLRHYVPEVIEVRQIAD